MATNLPDLRPAVSFELSNELSHLHEDNLKTGCDTWFEEREERPIADWRQVVDNPSTRDASHVGSGRRVRTAGRPVSAGRVQQSMSGEFDHGDDSGPPLALLSLGSLIFQSKEVRHVPLPYVERSVE